MPVCGRRRWRQTCPPLTDVSSCLGAELPARAGRAPGAAAVTSISTSQSSLSPGPARRWLAGPPSQTPGTPAARWLRVFAWKRRRVLSLSPADPGRKWLINRIYFLQFWGTSRVSAADTSPGSPTASPCVASRGGRARELCGPLSCRGSDSTGGPSPQDLSPPKAQLLTRSPKDRLGSLVGVGAGVGVGDTHVQAVFLKPKNVLRRHRPRAPQRCPPACDSAPP